MPLNFREIWLILNAKNKAERDLDAFSRDVRNAGSSIRIAQLEARRATLQAAQAQRTLDDAMHKTEISQLNNEKSAIRLQLAQSKLNNLTKEQIGVLRSKILELDKEILAHKEVLTASQAHTISISKQIEMYNKEISALKKNEEEIKRRRKEIEESLKVDKDRVKVGGELAKTYGKGISQLVSTLPGRLGGAGSLVIGTALMALGPAISASIGGAIAAGLGGGAIAAAIALQAKDPRIAAAGKDLGQTLLSGLRDSSNVMVQPILNAIQIIRNSFATILPDIRSIFGDAAKYVEPLTKGLVGIVEKMLPGISAAMKNLAPTFSIIATEAPRIGKAIGEFFEKVTSNSHTVAAGMKLIIDVIVHIINFVGDAIKKFEDLYLTYLKVKAVILDILILLSRLENFTNVSNGGQDWMKPNQTLVEARENVQKYINTIEGTGPAIKRVSDGTSVFKGALSDLNATTQVTISKFNEAKSAAESLFDQFMSVDQATAQTQEAIFGLKDALDGNGKSLYANTEGAVKNRLAILDAVQAAEAQRQKMIDSGVSVAEANRVYQENVNKIYAMAAALGISRSDLDKFLQKYRDLANMPNITKSVTVKYGTIGGEAVSGVLGSRIKMYAKGGSIAANQMSVIGEKGPELFVPKQAGTIYSNKYLQKMLATSGSYSGVTAGSQRKTVTNNFYITTQEIDPTVHAAKLGWELEGRMG